MALEIKQSLKLSQSLVITPQLQQAIKLLQLSQMELLDHIQQEMLENPLLEESPEEASNKDRNEVLPDSPEIRSESGEANPAEKVDTEVGGKEGDFREEPNDFDWENYSNTYNAPEMSSRPYEDLPSYEATLANKTTLFDHLLWQLQLSNLSFQELELGTLLLGGINEDGYLTDSLAEISQKTGASVEVLEELLKTIQDFDPPGIAARNLQECLLLQVRHLKPYQEVLEEIITKHLHLLERKDYHRISKEMKMPLEKVLCLAKLIYELEPKPGREYSSSEAQYISPDVFVKKVGRDWVVLLNEDGLPKLRINNLYRNMMNQKAESATKNYVQDKLRSAVWLIRSIHQRQRTLYRVTKSIVKFQGDFFEKGINFLKPMILRDVANEINMHESTVSRVTTNKYLHTPHGLFELKFFFSNGVSTLAGSDIASESVKNKIRGLISHENPKTPLSDQDIVSQLKDNNIDIARRTVAKYRETMGILPSSKRRQFY